MSRDKLREVSDCLKITPLLSFSIPYTSVNSPNERIDSLKLLCVYNGGQKCWDLSSDITKTIHPSPPTPNKVEFGAKWVKLSAFFDHHIARGSWGDDGMSPKPHKKFSLGAESYGTITWKGFFTQSQVLLSSIVDPLLIVLEYLPYGDLLGYLRKSRGHSDSYNTGEKKPASKLTAKDLLSFAWMIADGMHYLAKMKVR